MSPFSLHKEKDKSRRGSTSIKHAITSFLGNNSAGKSGEPSISGGNDGHSGAQGRSSARPKSVPSAGSSVPAAFSPMMMYGSPYSMYGSNDYGTPQNELAMTSDEGSDNELDGYNGNSSLLNFSLSERGSRGNRSGELYTSSGLARHNSANRPPTFNDEERGGPFSAVSDNDDTDVVEHDNDGDVEDGDEDDAEESYLGRRITRVSTGFSAAGSQLSSSVVNRRKRAKTFLLGYLADRGFLRPKLVSSKDGITFHIASRGDTLFLPTISPTDDEYLNHLSRINDDDAGFDDALERLATRDPSEVSRPEISRQESESTLPGVEQREQGLIPDGMEESLDSSVTGDTRSAPSSGAQNDALPAENTAPNNNSEESCAENVPHNIAVIMSLKKPMELSNVKAELYSRVRVYWSNGLPPDRFDTEEYYTGGHLEWEFTSNSYNLYLGFSAVDQDLIISENSENLCQPKTFKNLLDYGQRPYLKKNKTKDQFLKKINESPGDSPQAFQPGDYVFIVPVVFTNNIPETIYLPSARVNYYFRCAAKILNSEVASTTDNDSLRTQNMDSALSGNDTTSNLTPQSDSNDDSNTPSSTGDNSTSHFKFGKTKFFKKMKNHLHISSHHGISKSDYEKMIYGRMALNVVRTPPLRSISTADKPIYINRVWTDSLFYEISFGQKYVPLGAEIPLKIKLVPMVKHLSVKRVRVCVVEKITYVSKNLQFEFDQVDLVANDPYSPYYAEFTSRRKPDRILPLLEVRTRDKGCRAIKEEIVENCKSDNLLSYSTVRDDKTNSNVEMIEALTMETKVQFPKYKLLSKKTAKNIPPYGIDEFIQQEYIKSGVNSRRGSTTSGVIDFFSGMKSRKNSIVSNPEIPKNATKFRTNSNVEVINHTRVNTPKRGLYASSVNFSHINVRHKLEIMLRISKPDALDPTKQRHFEVLIDTPVYVVSELCTNDNLDLPTYAMATSARSPGEQSISFHEPLPSFEQAISVPNSPRMSPLGTPRLSGIHDCEDSYIQQLMLSRASTQTAEDSFASSQQPLSRRYTNIDEMIDGPGLGFETNPNSAVTFKRSFLDSSMKHKNPSTTNGNIDSEDEEAVLSDGEPPTYEEITPLM